MNLSQLIREVWKDKRVREVGFRQDEVKLLVEVTIDHIGKGLLRYGVIKLKNLFTLEIRQAKGRRIRNPQTGEEMHTNDYNKIGIIPSKKVKKGLESFKN